MNSPLSPFNMLEHLKKLTPDQGSHGKSSGSYLCPVCGAKNFKVDHKSGKYSSFGCDCMATPRGRRAVREAIAPLRWSKPSRPKQQRSWIYRDAAGQPLIEVHRIDNGEGQRRIWQTPLQNGKPADLKHRVFPYRYQQCVDAMQQGQNVFWVEGEPCADALWNIGIPATTTLGGSKNYRSEYYQGLFPAPTLITGTLVLCPDRDLQGLKYAEAIAADYPQAVWCYPFPDSFLWHRLQDNGGADIADWIFEGATAEIILAAVGEKKQWNVQTRQQDLQESTSNAKPNRFKQDYEYVQTLWSDRLRFNEYSKEIELDGEPIELGPTKVTLAVEENINISLNNLELILGHLANRHPYHPVRAYLNRCHQQYTATFILDNLAERYFGCQHPIYNTYLKRTLIAAVARIFEPGCKVDTALILQGLQGRKKSTFFKVLAGVDYFDDSLGAISDKDEKLKLHQTWFAEWAELESVFKRRDVAHTKAFLSSSVDVVRPPYGRQAIRMQRQSIIVGTTNQDQFLSDSTGNRRFWIIPVHREVNLKMLAEERDRLWGSAVALYQAGEQWWLSTLEEQQAEDLAKDYQTTDPWESRVEAHLIEWRLDEVTTGEILTNCLEIEVGHQSRGHEMRVADCLKRLGWQSIRKMYRGKRRRVWIQRERSSDDMTKEGQSYDQPSGHQFGGRVVLPRSGQLSVVSEGVDQPGQLNSASSHSDNLPESSAHLYDWEIAYAALSQRDSTAPLEHQQE